MRNAIAKSAAWISGARGWQQEPASPSHSVLGMGLAEREHVLRALAGGCAARDEDGAAGMLIEARIVHRSRIGERGGREYLHLLGNEPERAPGEVAQAAHVGISAAWMRGDEVVREELAESGAARRLVEAVLELEKRLDAGLAHRGEHVVHHVLRGELELARDVVLRESGHSPSEAFNETVEELTQSLGPLFGEKGMDWMYANCSTTAQRGALDWAPRFHDAIKPVMEWLYYSVKTGNEAQITIDANSKPDYRAGLEKELEAMRNQEMWRAGETVRKLRPENQEI